jgi:beta-mannosidase
MFYYLLMFYLCCISTCIQTQTIEINLNTNWVLSSKNLNININNVNLPTSVHSILRSQNLIPDPLYRYNDANLTWIFENDDWTFTNTFKIDNFTNLNKTSKINFIFDSVDTIASVYLNDKFILNTKNEFLKYQVENLNSKLNDNQNVLELKFSSATKYADAMAYLSPYRLPVGKFY